MMRNILNEPLSHHRKRRNAFQSSQVSSGDGCCVVIKDTVSLKCEVRKNNKS